MSSQYRVRALSLWGNLPVLVNFASAASMNDANSDDFKVPSCLQEQKSDCRVHPVDEEGHLQNRLHVPNLAEQELEIISPSADGHWRTFVTSAALCSMSVMAPV